VTGNCYNLHKRCNYQCNLRIRVRSCRCRFEKKQSINDSPLSMCPSAGQGAPRVAFHAHRLPRQRLLRNGPPQAESSGRRPSHETLLQRVTSASVAWVGRRLSDRPGWCPYRVANGTPKRTPIISFRRWSTCAFLRRRGQVNLSALDVKGELLLVSHSPCSPTPGRDAAPPSSTPPARTRRSLFQYCVKLAQATGSRSDRPLPGAHEGRDPQRRPGHHHAGQPGG